VRLQQILLLGLHLQVEADEVEHDGKQGQQARGDEEGAQHEEVYSQDAGVACVAVDARGNQPGLLPGQRHAKVFAQCHTSPAMPASRPMVPKTMPNPLAMALSKKAMRPNQTTLRALKM